MNDLALRPTGETLSAAQHVLNRLQTLFDAAIDTLARQCSAGGKLDAGRLDAWQFVSYELATASAELLAARTAVDHADSATPLDARLALVFAAEAAASVLAKLELAGLELSLDTPALHALASGPEMARLRLAGASGAALAGAGRAVAQSGAEIGQVELDEGLAMAQDAFRRLGAEVVAPMAEKIHRQDLTVPESLLQPMREMGVFGLSIPEQYGGSAPEGRGEASMMVVVTEALSEASLAAAGSLITRPEILARALLSGGTEAQKSRWLPGIAAGSPLCAIAITEPDYGSDVASLTLKATAAPGGWLLNGAKTWCTFAGKAGVLMVVARTGTDPTEGYRGLSILLVEKPSSDGHAFTHVQEAGGRLQGRAIPTIGYRGMHSFDLSFENFFVPQDNVIGGEKGLGKGFYFTMAGMMGGRMQTAAR
ncbi:MAG: acyl-CoA dehydrogenase family protein, partial [Burkholderiaceae bacterium]|nr:acyl-CoA dehydrogenase family protein [Burkholderiaceae bacterium]